MAPITEFVQLERVYGPQSVTRFNLFNAARVNGSAALGYSSGDAIRAIQELSETALPSNYTIGFSGLTREEIAADRKRVVSGTRLSVRVNPGGRRCIKKKK